MANVPVVLCSMLSQSAFIIFVQFLSAASLLLAVLAFPCLGGGNPLLSQALELVKSGQSEQAVTLLRDLERRLPDDGQVKRMLGEAYLATGVQRLHSGSAGDARDAFLTAHDYLPDDFRPLQGLALAWLSADQPAAAIAPLQEAEVLAGASPELSLLLGRAYYALGELDQAEEAWSSALQGGASEAPALLEKLRRERQIESTMDRRLGGRFRLGYAAGVNDSLAGEIIDTLQEAYLELGREFAAYPDMEIPVLLYPRQQFAEVTGSPSWAGALYDGKIRLPAGGLQQLTPQLKALLYHEYSHVLVRFLARDRAPVWLNEGLAQLVEERYHPLAARVIPGVVLPEGTLERPFTALSAELASTAYARSYRRVEKLHATCGAQAISDLLRQLGAGLSWPEASAHAFAPCGFDWPSLESLIDES